MPCASSQSQVDRLEREIDAMNAALEPLRSFILPGGGARSAALHLARAVPAGPSARPSRSHEAEPLNPLALAYLNRLSDHLFVAARYVAKTRAATSCGSRARPEAMARAEHLRTFTCLGHRFGQGARDGQGGLAPSPQGRRPR